MRLKDHWKYLIHNMKVRTRFFYLRHLNRGFKENELMRLKVASIAANLSRYLGEEDDGVWKYSSSIGSQRKLTVWYSERHSRRELPKATLRLEEKVEDEWVIISQINPHEFDFKYRGLPKSYRYQNMNLPDQSYIFMGELDPELVVEAAEGHFEDVRDEIRAGVKFFFDWNLKKFIPFVSGLSSLDPLSSNSFDIPRQELESLEEELINIFGSDDLFGVKMHRAGKVAGALCDKYQEIYRKKQEAVLELERARAQEAPQREVIYHSPDPFTRLTQVTGDLEDLVASEKVGEDGIGTGISGFRRDINLSVRSTWEANFARVLLLKGYNFTYEPQSFKLDVPPEMRKLFDGREEVEYIPDFKVYDGQHNKFVEIKGNWFQNRGQEAMAKVILFQIQYPDCELYVLGVNEYRKLEREYREEIDSSSLFCGWERGSRKSGHNLATSPEDFA